jgi:hypothetical protein
MSKLLASRGAQWPLFQEFIFNFNDWAVDSVDGSKKTFGAAVTNSGTVTAIDPATGDTVPLLVSGTGIVLDAIPMPIGAVLQDVKAFVETAFAGIGASATLSLGVAGNTTAVVNAADLDAATSGSQLTVASFSPTLCNNGQNLRLTLAGLAATATAGRVRIRVQYTIDGRVTENSIS